MSITKGNRVKRMLWSRLQAVLLAFLMVPVYPGYAISAEEKVTIDFRNVDISEFVKTVSKLTKRNFLLDQGVRGTVTILGPRPVGVSEIWRIFHSVLAVKGLTVVKVGKLYKIVQRKNAKQQPVPILVGRDIPEISEEPVIQIVPMDFSSATDAKTFLDSFKSASGEILVHEPTNSLIIADQRDYIARMLRLLDHMDSAEVEEVIEILPVTNISVENAVKLINEILKATEGDAKVKTPSRRRRANPKAASSGSKGAKIVSDTRLNRMIIIGTKSEVEEIQDLLAMLDVEETNLQQNVHVYQLQHADAETLAGTLNSIGSTASAKKGKNTGGQVKIVADKQNNSLIFITENSEDLKAQLNLLEKLDVPKAQVYIQAAIVEVSLEGSGAFALGLAGGVQQTIFGQDGFIGGGEALDQAPILLDPTSLFSGGLFAGAIVTPGDGGLPPIGAILKAVRGNADTNVLSTPQILTSDNEEAEIVVGDNVPFLTGQTATSGGNVISSIDRRDVGITLRVTPQVNDSGMVRLEIFQEISDVGSAPSGFDVNQQGLVTKKRSARTNVVIRDGQTIAIGGLYTNSESVSQTKIPILGDIPILGWLFKSTKKQKRRTNLILFLEPKVVRDSNELHKVSLGITEHFMDRYGHKFNDEQEEFFDSVTRSSYEYIANAEAEFERDMVVELDANIEDLQTIQEVSDEAITEEVLEDGMNVVSEPLDPVSAPVPATAAAAVSSSAPVSMPSPLSVTDEATTP